ncbi:hypothetical protein SCLCIDRAFT_1212126 [Scleroderma citrinum Foug A]|uniref:Uncharacterized protein n=1 Tax=Scleroderma citrinum Foug A TaxID=1036808 RepID=A0A0C3EBM4_9AGAM|nr:hypothetical protein SCLCIDRAFT_1212126 [Scleroderma citrinum Foug A]
MHSIANETETPPDEVETIRTSRNEQKRPNSPDRAARGRPDKLNGCGNHADRSSIYMDMPSAGYDMETAEDKVETIKIIRTCQNGAKMQNSPNGHKIWSTCRWRRVSIVVINIYILLNVPVTVPSQKFSKHHGWLQRVTIYATAEERKTRTYLCRPGHPLTTQNVQTDSLNVDIDAITSKSNLQRSIQRRTAKKLT